MSIISRWFILDEDRTRDGQYKLTLRRGGYNERTKDLFYIRSSWICLSN